MATTFRARLKVLAAEDTDASVGAAAFALQEGYNTGWGGTAAIVASGNDETPMTSGTMLSAVMASGVRAGRAVSLQLVIHGGALNGTAARTWPCVVEGLRPYRVDDRSAACYVALLDPVSFLAEQPIWGAYRSVSAGEVVGGALSLAAGGDGKPTLSPILPGMPQISIRASYRDSLATIPHAIAAGQTLGDWLSEFFALLGLRAELSCSDETGIVLELLDSVPTRQPLEMTVVATRGDLAETETDDTGSSGGTSTGDGTGSSGGTSTGDGTGSSGGESTGDGTGSSGGESTGDGTGSSGGESTGDGTGSSGGESTGDGRILLTGHAAFPGVPRRGGIVDDPTLGSARAVYALGSAGAVLTGPGLDTNEAAGRIHRSLVGTYTEMLMVSATTGQPRMRVGEKLALSREVHAIDAWQVAGVAHRLRGGGYDNDVTLLRGDKSWHPELPVHRPPVYVTGVVDGGNDYHIHEPVPRDRLGRVKVSFPFTPTPVGEEAAQIAAADTTGDMRILLEDYTDEQIDSYTLDKATWDADVAKYEAGDFDDPYPGKTDDDLTAEELENREDLRASRARTLAYMAYLKASADRDQDGVISDRDRIISDKLSSRLKSAEGRERMQELWNMGVKDRTRHFEETMTRYAMAEEFNRFGGNLDPWAITQENVDAQLEYYKEGGGTDSYRTRYEGKLADIEAREELVQEYGRLFEAERDGLSEKEVAARRDAEEVADHWPPRIPLPVINPMAGAMHGFISAHRHGDTCRVAVYNPLTAEIVGFQYREDRRINEDVTSAVAGFVVEHDYSEAWSGVVFRRKDPTVEEDDDEGGDSGDTDDTGDTSGGGSGTSGGGSGTSGGGGSGTSGGGGSGTSGGGGSGTSGGGGSGTSGGGSGTSVGGGGTSGG